jgi:hypothetical protein
MTVNKTFKPSDLRKQGQQLVESCQMPSLDELLQAVFEARRKYVQRILGGFRAKAASAAGISQ